MTYALADSGAEILVVDDAFAELVPTLAGPGARVRAVVHADDGPTPAGMLGYENLIAGSEPVEDARRGDEDLATVMYTGGTSRATCTRYRRS